MEKTNKNIRLVILSVILLCAFALSMTAQNIQVHYDFGKNISKAENKDNADRCPITITLEQFALDKCGNWYYFVDFDADGGGMRGAYTEINREFNAFTLGQLKVNAHLQHNMGMVVGRENSFGSSFKHQSLIGTTLNGQVKNNTWSLGVLYLYNHANRFRHAENSYMITTAWSVNVTSIITFSGFANLWRDNEVDSKLIFLSEPQIWYNLTPNSKGIKLHVGTECEISNNFVASKTNRVWNNSEHQTMFLNPTIAVKFEF